MHPYLLFPGNAEEAFGFYKEIFGGEYTRLSRFADAPATGFSGDLSAKEQQLIMHISLPIGDTAILMGSDAHPKFNDVTQGNAVSVSITLDSAAEARRIFDALAVDGKITMPLERQFWGATFGMVDDKYGFHWMVDCEEVPEKPFTG